MTTFIEACKRGNIDQVKVLATTEVDYDCAVLWASVKGHIDIVKYLMSQGVHVITDCAIQGASRNGHLEVVMYLVSQGANVQLAIRCASMNGHLEVVMYLVSQGADIQAENNEAVQLASEYAHLEVIMYLVSQGANIRACNNFAIRCAERAGHIEVVKYLTSQDNISETALNSFCKKMQEKVRIRAQKKIYRWWIKICYDLSHKCGKRFALRMYDTTGYFTSNYAKDCLGFY